MTFAQFLVTSLLGLVVYAFGFHRGLKRGFEMGQRTKVEKFPPAALEKP